MQVIEHDQAEQRALERAENILDLHLEQEVRERLPDGLPSYFYAPSALYLSSELIDDMLRGQHVALAVFPRTESRVTGTHSATPTHKEHVLRWELRAALCFVAPDEAGGYRAQRASGRLETQREFTERLARAYRGALLEILLKHLQHGAGIVRVQMINAHSTANNFDQLGIIGRAWADVEVLQTVTVPTPAYEVPDGQ